MATSYVGNVSDSFDECKGYANHDTAAAAMRRFHAALGDCGGERACNFILARNARGRIVPIICNVPEKHFQRVFAVARSFQVVIVN